MKHLLLSILSLFIFYTSLPVFGQVVINEYSCSNVTGIVDAYG
ncbi:MAG: hypothetical protein RLZZ107_220, partial [Bacteroidota bacterium]